MDINPYMGREGKYVDDKAILRVNIADYRAIGTPQEELFEFVATEITKDGAKEFHIGKKFSRRRLLGQESWWSLLFEQTL